MDMTKINKDTVMIINFTVYTTVHAIKGIIAKTFGRV